MNDKNNILYNKDLDNFTVFFYDEPKFLKEYLESEGFVDAQVLEDNWYVYRYSVYKLPIDWQKQIRDYHFITLDFVGNAWHVIPRNQQTCSQYSFIKSIYDD